MTTYISQRPILLLQPPIIHMVHFQMLMALLRRLRLRDLEDRIRVNIHGLQHQMARHELSSSHPSIALLEQLLEHLLLRNQELQVPSTIRAPTTLQTNTNNNRVNIATIPLQRHRAQDIAHHFHRLDMWMHKTTFEITIHLVSTKWTMTMEGAAD